MGNAGSNIPRERHKSTSSDMPSSPVKDGQPFVFDKNPEKNVQYQGSSHEEEEPYYTKPVTTSSEATIATAIDTTANLTDENISDTEDILKEPTKQALPTVFKWFVLNCALNFGFFLLN